LRLWRLAEIVVLFVGVAPPVGMIVLVSSILFGFGFPAPRTAVRPFDLLMYGLISYYIGCIPAAIAGLIVGAKQVYFAGAGWRFALGVGMLFGILSGFTTVGTHDGYLPVTGTDWKLLITVCTAPTLSILVCWSIIKSWYLERPAGGEAKS
jgi:hypothetical protein